MYKGILFLIFVVFQNLLSAQETGKFLAQEFESKGDTLKYRILYPKGFSEGKKYPLVLFLHGAGERGNDNESQLIHGSELFIENDRTGKNPAIVVFPQCPANDFWASVKREDDRLKFEFPESPEPTKALSLVSGLLDDLLERKYVEEHQVYIGGLSMGGMGTFELLQRRPNTFAAAIAICGGGNPDNVHRYAANTPVWIFHGAKDEVVPPVHSVRMATALEAAGGKVRFTMYEEANHNSWDSAFAEPQLLDWLFSFQLDEK